MKLGSDVMVKIHNNSTIVVTDDVVSCDLDDEAAILNLKNGVYYGLNPVGAFIWNLIQKPITINEIIDILLMEYDVKNEICQNDVMDLVENLLDNRLVKVNE